MVCLSARKHSRHRDGPMGGAKHLPYNIGESIAPVIVTVPTVPRFRPFSCENSFICAKDRLKPELP